MAAIPLAFSAHHFISTVGADAGFAAIIGLAILALLFFSQARETTSLRERAAESEDQVRRLAAYVDQLSRSSVGSTPAPAPSRTAASDTGAGPAVAAPRVLAARTEGAVSPAPAVPSAPAVPERAQVAARAVIPAAPAGVGAPALSAATRLIPGSGADPISIRSMASDRAGAGSATGAAVMEPPAPPPSTAAAGGNGGGSRTGAGAVGAAGAAGSAGAAGNQPPPRVAIRRNEASAPARPPASPSRRPAANGSSGHSRISRGAIAIATVLVVVVIAAGLLVLTSSSGSSSQSTSSTQASQTTSKKSSGRRHAVAAVTPSAITVAVLNGTSTSNLAHDVATKLTAARYKQGTVATASDQTLTATIVGYLPGHRQDAIAVAKSLKLGSASVQAVDPANRAVACSGSSSSCSAQVVVTVGSDLASLA
jgi:hypothetical protein